MKQAKTYTDSGWDFADTWKIGEGLSYPTLQWQQWTVDEQITADTLALIWDSIKNNNDSENNVTTSLTLPKIGAKGSNISWSVSPDDGCINTDTGEVTRPIGEDKNVVLTATISKDGGTSQTKEFMLTVMGQSKYDYDLTLDAQVNQPYVTVTANAEKLNPDAQDGVLILALYYESRLMDIFIDEEMTGNIYETTVNLSLFGYDISEDIYVKGFVWDSIENMKPMYEGTVLSLTLPNYIILNLTAKK